jgi:protein TonB
MKGFALIFFVCLMANGLAAQSRFQDPATGKWGFRDNEWNVLIPAIYDEVQPHFDTIIAVKKDGKMAALDIKGNYRIPLIYEQIMPNLSPFPSQYGYAAVTKNNAQRNTWGMVDAYGKVILPEKFQYVRAITPTLLVGRVDGDSILQFHNSKGKLLYKIAGKKIEPIDIDNTCFGVDGIDRKTRFYKLDGTLVYPADPKSGMWTDGERTILRKDNQWGMIDAKGETIIPFEFSRIKHGLPGQFLVEKRDEKYAYGGMGVYDKNGKVVMPVAHLSIVPFGKIYRVHDLSADKNGISSEKGAEILPALYHFSTVYISESNYGKNIPSSHPERYISVTNMENRQQFLIRDDGTIIRPEGSQRVTYHSEIHPLIIDLIPPDDKQMPQKMAIDFKGKVLLPAEYIFLDFTPNPGVLLGRKQPNTSIGFISLAAPQKTEFLYEYRSRLSNGYYRMSAGKKYDLYNPQLKRVHSGEYNWFNEPTRDQFEQFRAAKKTKEKLVATAFRQGMAYDDWLAITESGKEFLFKKPEEKPVPPPPAKPAEPVEEVIMEEMDVAVEAPPPPMEVDAAEQVFQMFDVQTAPQYPGGEDSLARYLIRNLKYPRLAAENGIQGMTVLKFVIERDGSISNVNLVRDIGGGCGQEAKRLIEAMPKWTPGLKNGKPVRVQYQMPVRFKLE